MRVTVVQMNSGADKAANLAKAERLIRAAAARDRPDLVMLPETFTVMGGGEEARRAAAEAPGDGEAHAMLSNLARETGVIVHGGSWFQHEGGGLTNASVVFDREGREAARYRKIHLFDVETPDGKSYRESDYTIPGGEVVVVPAGRLGEGAFALGLSICYDLRFGELYRQLRAQGAELVAAPAAFTLHTGLAHWDLLLRARAVETQCYVAAAAQCGPHHPKAGDARETYGHAMIVDPWGTVLAQAPDGEGFATATLDRGRMEAVRAKLPVERHRRL